MIFLMPTQEFGGAVMMTISLKLVLYQMEFILERVNKYILESDFRLNRCIICCLYPDKPSGKIQLFSSRIHQHVQNQSYEENN